MKKSRYSESQIISILKEAENGVPVAELCRKHGMSDATFYNWRSKYGGMDISMLKRMKELEEENRRLKKTYAEERLKAEIVQEALEKSGKAISAQRDGPASGESTPDIHTPGLQGLQDKRDLLSVSGEALRRECPHCGLAATIDYNPPHLGFWIVFPVSAQCEGLQIQSQARLPDLSGVGA